MPQRPPASIAMLQRVIRRFHGERADRGAGKLDGVAGGAVGADPGDDRKRKVLGGDVLGEPAVNGDPHALGLFLPKRLRHQHMGDFRRADAERECAEGAMRRGVAVAANDQKTRQGQSQFRADDMNDALTRVLQPEQGDALIGGCSSRDR